MTLVIKFNKNLQLCLLQKLVELYLHVKAALINPCDDAMVEIGGVYVRCGSLQMGSVF